MQRAWRIGYECFVADGKLTFRPPSSTNGSRVTLTWGRDLLEFRPRMTLGEQVDEVVVKGWDVSRQETIVGRADSGQLYPQISESQDGAEWASAFGAGKRVIVDQPVVSQSEADVLASARLNEISGAFVGAEGVAFRRPDIRAGQSVTLEALGERLSGTYLVTSATHRYTANGLETNFTARGTRTGLLMEQITRQAPLDRWPGVVTGVVTNVDDPVHWGRIKLRFPWMTDDAESDWARVIGAGAGPECGLYAMPAVDDEVLVAFAHGDFSQPFVLGGLWNGQHERPPEAGSGGEQPLVRIWRSRNGHTISLDDANGKVEVVSNGGLSLVLDDNGRKVTIDSTGDIEITAGGNLQLEANGNMDLSANGQVTVQGATINLN